MKNFILPPKTKVKVIAYHKKTDYEFTKTMTLAEWLTLKKSKDYNYKCLQI